MPCKKEKGRKIFEAQYGKAIRPEQWEAIKAEMKKAGMPMIAKNVVFVAKCKRIASRTPVYAPVLQKVVEAAAVLGDEAYGHEIKTLAFKLNAHLSRDKFYRVFRDEGYPFSVVARFKPHDLGEVLYKLFSEK